MSGIPTASDASDGLIRVHSAGVELTLRLRGSGPPVVLLHGTSANFAVWEPIADALAGQAEVVSLDQRGHGRSGKPRTGYDAVSFADDVVAVLDALDIERAVVVGHSLGARNAWVAAARHPDRVRGVLAVDYVPFVEKPVLDALQVRVAGGDRVFASLSEIEDYLRNRYPRMPVDAISRRARWGYEQSESAGWKPLAPAFAMDAVVEGLRKAWDAEFAAVRAPLTCLKGRASAIVSDQAWARAMALRPDARWVVVDGADHYVPEERPEVVVDEIRMMLAGDDTPT